MNLFVLFDIFDIGTFISLCICTIVAWKLYKRTFAPQTSYLFIGFLLMTLLQIGFIVINFIPINMEPNWNRFIGELTVAARFIPVSLIMVGLIKLFKDVVKYFK